MVVLPKITVIIPSFNSEKYIESCVENVFEQDYQNLELLVMDGASKDQTLDRLRECAGKFPKLQYFSEKDNGIGDAINKGIEKSTGEWIYVLGADDKFYNSTVLSDIFREPENLDNDVIYGNVLFTPENIVYAGEFDNENIVRKNICHQAIFIRKSLHDTLGNYSTKYKLLSDYDFNLRWMANDNVRVKYIDKIIALYNHTGITSRVIDSDFIKDKDELLLKYGIFNKHSFEYAREKYNEVLNSREYKLGKSLLAPIKKLKRAFLKLR